MRYLFILSFSCLLLIVPCALHAQVAGSLDQAFNPVVNGTPTSLATAVQPDGKILIGGEFTGVNGQSQNRIARLNPDGTLESTATFNPGTGADSWIYCLTLQADGKILLGGRFTSINGQPRYHLARLNPNGSVEDTSTFTPISGLGGEGYIWSLALQADGKILVGGLFTSVNGQPRNGIARLNADGSLEDVTTFDPGSGANSNVVSVAVQADGKILLAGDFTTINGQPRGYVARLNADGTLENTATFNPGSGANASVQSVVVQADGKILLGGYFTSVNGQPRNHIARLNANGTLESTATFNTGTGVDGGTGPVYAVISMAVQADGRILLAGDFTGVNGQSRNRIARLNPDGSLESAATFNPGIGADDIIYGASILADGKILLGGAFTSIDGQPRQRIARLANDGASQSFIIPDTTRVQWFRSGAAPEVEQVSFDLSTNGGANWTPLGAGTRVVGGWERAGLSIPANGLIRARGRTAGSYHNGTSGIVESVTSISAVFGGINDGLVASYPFSGNANDTSGRGNHGAVMDAVLTEDRFGVPNSAYDFNGTSSRIVVPDSDATDLIADFSICAWIRPRTLNPAGIHDIVTKHIAGSPVDGSWVFKINYAAPAFEATPYFDPQVNAGQTLLTNLWHHVMFTYRRATGEWHYYINGQQTATGTRAYSIQNTGLPLLIGCEGHPSYSPPYYWFFDGAIDDIRIWDRSLSPNEIRSLFAPPLTITGAVSSSLGPVISGAAIKLQRSGLVFWEGVSGPDGFFHPPPLLAQSFTVKVTKAGFTTFVQNIEGETGGQRLLEMVLRPAPAPPATQATARQPTQNEKGATPAVVAVPMDSPEPQLRIFDGVSAFVKVQPSGPNSLRQDAMTVVMTHGWNSAPEVWALQLALAIRSHHGLTTLPNITAWHWHDESATPLPTPDRTPEQGRLLGQALRRRLGYDAYAQPIHFIGHSLGTLVNRYACDDAHQRGVSNVGEIGFDPLLTRPHITLLDEAELASFLGTSVVTSAAVAAKVAGWGGAIGAGIVATYKDWKSPVPATPVSWMDSYISMVGIQRPQAVNVCLTAPAIGYLSVVEAHAYSYQWYQNSVLPPWPVVGFHQSRESGGFLPPPGNGMTPGSLWYENLNQPMALNLAADPHSLECTISILSMYAVRTASAALPAVGQAVLDGYEAGIEWLGDKGGDLIIRGQHAAVVVGEKIGEGWDAAQDRASEFVDLINPALQIRNIVAADFRILLRRPAQNIPRVPRGADTDPSAWLTVNVPANAGLLQFDFTVTGDAGGARIACGVGGQNVFNLPAVYAPQGEVQSTDLIDISEHAGQSVELYFGLVGGSTDCELAIDGIRFITIPQPTLVAIDGGDHLELKWPAAATGWRLEASEDLNSWAEVPDVANATAVQGVLTLAQPRTPGRHFFRLRRVE